VRDSSPGSSDAIVVHGLSHRYPGAAQPALRDVQLRIRAGERVGLLGPNGAGKSTLLRLLCGVLPLQVPATGASPIRIGGLDPRDDPESARAQVGYLPEHVPLYRELTAREHLRHRARIKGLPGAWSRAVVREIERVAAATAITSRLDAAIATLSRGYRQRVGIADALLGAPPIVVLDEPTVGLDPHQLRDVREVLRGLSAAGSGQTLLFSSHILSEVEALCDRVIVLADGRVVADETIAEATQAGVVIAAWSQAAAAPVAALLAAHAALIDAVEWVTPAAVGGGELPPGALAEVRVRLKTPAPAQLRAALGGGSLAEGLALSELSEGRRALEERFLRVTAGDLPAAAGTQAPAEAGG
jgi:ABC-2 type transport system ATP-binding protein